MTNVQLTSQEGSSASTNHNLHYCLQMSLCWCPPTLLFFCSFSPFSLSAFILVAICCTGCSERAQLNCQRTS